MGGRGQADGLGKRAAEDFEMTARVTAELMSAGGESRLKGGCSHDWLPHKGMYSNYKDFSKWCYSISADRSPRPSYVIR